MARLKSDILSGYGKGFEVLKAFVNAILDNGGTDEDVLRIVKDKAMADKVAKLILADRGVIPTDGCELLSVNYALKFVEAIAAGAFDWKNDDIIEQNFPNQTHETGEQNLTVKLFHFGREMSSEDVIKAMDADGFRPATLRELLAFGAKNPDEQRKYPIVGFGSLWRHLDDRFVPCLVFSGDARRLGLGWWSYDWFGFCRFLAVRKS